MPIKPIQNSNNTSSNNALTISPSLRSRLNSVQTGAVASPTPVIAGAPIQTQEKDSVEIQTQEKEKKFDSTVLLAFIIGVITSVGVGAVVRKMLNR